MRVKRRDLIQELGRMLIPVPRHREVNERTAQGILRDARRFVEEEAR